MMAHWCTDKKINFVTRFRSPTRTWSTDGNLLNILPQVSPWYTEIGACIILALFCETGSLTVQTFESTINSPRIGNHYATYILLSVNNTWHTLFTNVNFLIFTLITFNFDQEICICMIYYDLKAPKRRFTPSFQTLSWCLFEFLTLQFSTILNHWWGFNTRNERMTYLILRN